MEEAGYGWKLGNPIGSKPDFVCALPNLLEKSPGFGFFFGRKSSFPGCLLRCSNALKIISGLFDSVFVTSNGLTRLLLLHVLVIIFKALLQQCAEPPCTESGAFRS